jgi:16S rRNA (cytosine967-C5)-methyltransferase
MTHSAPALWQLLQASAGVLAQVRAGRSTTAVFDTLDPALRPGVQALSLQVLRRLGLALALRRQLASRPPPAASDALLCTALALLVADPAPYPPHTLVAQAVEAAKRNRATEAQAAFINACLRRMLRERAQLLAAAHGPEARWNHPAWWVERLAQDHPAHWQAILASGDRPAALVLRVNTRRVSRAQCLRLWNEAGIAAEPVGDSGLRLLRSQPVAALPGYAQGWFSVQDEAAQRAAPLLLRGLAPAGERLRLLDACAAPGGKTAHLLEQTEADVLALDIDPDRTRRIEDNLGRLGLRAQIEVADAAEPARWWDGRLFDGILHDAPCTASGIVRRHPDVRWLRRPDDVAELAAQQSRLLQALWPLVRPGGRLLFCTCSVFKAEGQDQVQAFLARHRQAQLLPSPGHLLPGMGTAQASLPDNAICEHDGFFYALLQRGDRQ